MCGGVCTGPMNRGLHLSINSTNIQQIFIEQLLCARHCARRCTDDVPVLM